MTNPAPLPRRLTHRRLVARSVLLFEAVWPSLWPPLGVLGVFLCLALLDIPAMLPGSAAAALLAVTLAVAAGLLLYGLRGLRLPHDHDADRRLERASGLTHRPLSVLSDAPAATDPASLALWQAHVARTLARIGHLRVGWPHPGLARRDPRALRHAVLLSLVACLVIANADAPARLYAAFTPSVHFGPATPATEVQAWVTPPAYTGVAPVFLQPAGGNVTVPAGSRLMVNVSGGTSAPVLVLDHNRAKFTPLDSQSFQAERALTSSGLLQIRRDGDALATWTVTVLADQPPSVAWAGTPGARPPAQETRLPWQVSDDYGVVRLQAELRLQARPNAPPLMITIPLPPGQAKSAHGIAAPDLTASPWAGLPVIGRLIGHDGAGHQGVSPPVVFTIGERPFHNPIARLLIAARKSLSIDPDDRTKALTILGGLIRHPGVFGDDLGVFTILGFIDVSLADPHDTDAVPVAQSMLWRLALHLEDGQAARTARQLDAARKAARAAMNHAEQHPDAQTRKAVERKLEALRQAIQRHMQALMRQAQRHDAIAQVDPNTMRLSDREMQRLAQRAEESAREGRMADAQRQMAQLERMLDQLRNARIGQAGKTANAQNQRGPTPSGVIQDLVTREAALLDHAQQRADPDSAMAESPATQAKHQTQRQADAGVQRALRLALGELMQQFADLTGKVAPSLGDADEAMRKSADALDQGRDRLARQMQQQAIADLQKGNQQMGQAVAGMGGQPGQSGGAPGHHDGDGLSLVLSPRDGQGPGFSNRDGPGQRDPLGRALNGNGSGNPYGGGSEDAEIAMPSRPDHQRTRAIMDELRRRGADRQRPRQELDYINRLLDQF